MITVAPCKVGTPPTSSMASVRMPMARDQNSRTGLEPSASESFRCEVKFAITSAPESALVT
ncbi:hypothetical protein D3C74_480150 [compost metagenome]